MKMREMMTIVEGSQVGISAVHKAWLERIAAQGAGRKQPDPPEQLAEPEEPEQASSIPKILYHGTGPVSAAMIMKSGVLQATEPVDEDGLGATVSLTASAKVAHDFACEYARLASPYDVGFVFTLNGVLVAADCNVVPHTAETASSDEEEFRAQANLPVKKYVTDIRATGDVDLLNDKDFVRTMFNDSSDNSYFTAVFPSFASFSAVIRKISKRR